MAEETDSDKHASLLNLEFVMTVKKFYGTCPLSLIHGARQCEVLHPGKLRLYSRLDWAKKPARSLYYKTFYGRNLPIFVISQSVCP
jgi:hypothetical protein